MDSLQQVCPKILLLPATCCYWSSLQPLWTRLLGRRFSSSLFLLSSHLLLVTKNPILIRLQPKINTCILGEKRSRRPLIISQLGVTEAGARHSLHPIIIHVHLLFYQISAQYQIAPAGQGRRADPLPVLSQGWCNPVFYRMSVSWIPSRWHQHFRINSQRSLQWEYVQS